MNQSFINVLSFRKWFLLKSKKIVWICRLTPIAHITMTFGCKQTPKHLMFIPTIFIFYLFSLEYHESSVSSVKHYSIGVCRYINVMLTFPRINLPPLSFILTHYFIAHWLIVSFYLLFIIDSGYSLFNHWLTILFYDLSNMGHHLCLFGLSIMERFDLRHDNYDKMCDYNFICDIVDSVNIWYYLLLTSI